MSTSDLQVSVHRSLEVGDWQTSPQGGRASWGQESFSLRDC